MWSDFDSLIYPEGQHIKTNQQNILIRALKLKNVSDSSKKRYHSHTPPFVEESSVSYNCWVFHYFVLPGSFLMQSSYGMSWIHLCLYFYPGLVLLIFELFVRTAEKVLGASAKKLNNQTTPQQGVFRWSLWCISHWDRAHTSFFAGDKSSYLFSWDCYFVFLILKCV